VTVEQLRSNVRAAALARSPDELADLAKMAEPPEQYWKERSRLTWS
jgi:hypothetical protein